MFLQIRSYAPLYIVFVPWQKVKKMKYFCKAFIE